MKRFAHLMLALALCLWCLCAAGGAVRLGPGLSAPDIADGARLDAAVLVSTNAGASCTVKAVYELPLYETVQSVTSVTNDYYVLSTNVVVGTNATLDVTGLYTVVTNSGVVATNYFTVWTNSWPVMVNRPTVATVTNNLLELTGTVAYTNDLFSLSGGYAETNNVNRWIVSPARFLVTGAPVTLIFTR